MKNFIKSKWCMALILLAVPLAVGAAVGPSGFMSILASGRALVSDANSYLRVSTEGAKATYGAVKAGVTLAASPTDFMTLIGSATKTVKVKHVTVCGSSGNATAFPLDVTLAMRTTLDVNGTAVTPTIAKFDSTDGNATGVVKHYTANPASLGAGKYVRSKTLAIPASTSTNCVDFDFARSNDKPLYLRGAAQNMAVYLNAGTVVASSKLAYDIVWEETAE